MTQEEYDKIDAVRAMCMGFSVAIQLSLKGEGSLNLEAMQERLQNGNVTLAGILNDYPELYHNPFVK
jgi:hypothetical protein